MLEEEQEAEGDGSSAVWPSRRCNGLGGRPRWSVAHHTSHAALRGLICFNFLINRMEVRIPVPGVNILLFISNLMNKEKIFKATSKSKIWWRECFREMNLSEGSELEWDKRKFRRMNEGMEDFHNTLCFPSLQLHYSAFCHYMEIRKKKLLTKRIKAYLAHSFGSLSARPDASLVGLWGWYCCWKNSQTVKSITGQEEMHMSPLMWALPEPPELIARTPL